VLARSPGRRSLPLPRRAFARQSLVGAGGGIRIQGLSGDRFFIATAEDAVITDASLRVIRRFRMPRYPIEVLGILPSERRLVTRLGIVETDGTVAPAREAFLYVAASAEGDRFVRSGHDETTTVLVVESGDALDEIARLEVTGEAIARAYRLHAPSLSATDDDATDSSDAGPPDDEPLDDADHASLQPEGVALRGNLLAALFATATGPRLCTFDVRARALVACADPPRSEGLPSIWAGSHHICVGSRPFVDGCVDVATLTSVPGLEDAAGRFRVARSPFPNGSAEVRDAASDRVVVPRLEESVGFAFEGSIGAYVLDDGVHVFDDQGSHDEVTFDASVQLDPHGGPFVDAEVQIVAGRVLLVSPYGGVALVRPGTSSISFDLPASMEPEVAVTSDRFAIALGPMNLAIGADGVDADVELRSPEHARLRSDIDDAAARAERLLPERDRGAVAFPHPSTPGIALAALVRGTVRILDGEGHDVVAPIPLPRAVVESGCYSFEFATDDDLLLHGRTPCIPTRIHIRARRTEPLGPAYVALARTPDGARAAMLADRHVTILDGRSGATLVTFDPQVEHPRSVTLGDDGRRGAVSGVGESSAFEISDDASVPPRVHRFPSGASDLQLDLVNGLLLGCDGARVSIRDAFGDETTTVPFVPCGIANDILHYRPPFVAIPGYVAMLADRTFAVVRLRDDAVFMVHVEASSRGIALLALEGENVVAVYPPDTTLFAVRDPETFEPFVATSGPRSFAESVRAFFAAP